MCAWLCFYFLSLFTVFFVARAFSGYFVVRTRVLISSVCCILTLDANFSLLTVTILFSFPILTFVR